MTKPTWEARQNEIATYLYRDGKLVKWFYGGRSQADQLAAAAKFAKVDRGEFVLVRC